MEFYGLFRWRVVQSRMAIPRMMMMMKRMMMNRTNAHTDKRKRNRKIAMRRGRRRMLLDHPSRSFWRCRDDRLLLLLLLHPLPVVVVSVATFAGSSDFRRCTFSRCKPNERSSVVQRALAVFSFLLGAIVQIGSAVRSLFFAWVLFVFAGPSTRIEVPTSGFNGKSES